MDSKTLVISRVRDQARNIRSFDLKPTGALKPAGINAAHGISFAPGQVAIIKVGDEEPCYFAFASAPEDNEIELLVKKKIGGSKVIFDMLVGDRIELTGIVGNGFPLSEQTGRDLVFVAMGTGVAPLRSALRSVLKRKSEYGQLVVLYGAQTPDDFCYRDEVDSWAQQGVELRQVISRPDGHDWSGPTGYVQSLLDNVLPNLKSPVALICGSLQMLTETRETLGALGFKPNEILTNY